MNNYGISNIEELWYEDYKKVFNEKHENLAHFEDEDNPLLNQRTVSRRRGLKLNNVQNET